MKSIIRTAYVAVIGALLVAALGPGSPTVSAAPDSAGSASALAATATATIQVTVDKDQWDDPTKPASATSGCSLREALQLAYNTDGNRGCGTPVLGSNITIQMFPGTYLLTNTLVLPNIGNGRTVTIAGPGVVIDGGGDVTKVFEPRQEGIFRIVDGVLILKNL